MSYITVDLNNLNAKTVGGASLSQIVPAFISCNNSSTSGYIIIETGARKTNSNMVTAMLFGYTHNVYLPIITTVKCYVYTEGNQFYRPYAFNIGYQSLSPVHVFINSDGFLCIAITRYLYTKLLAYVNIGNSALNSVRSITYAAELPSVKEWYQQIIPQKNVTDENIGSYVAQSASLQTFEADVKGLDLQNTDNKQNVIGGGNG